MKTSLFAVLFPVLSIAAFGQAGNPAAAPAPAAAATPFQTPALLINSDGSFAKAWLVAATKSSIRYRETEVGVDTRDSRVSEFSAIYLYEPREFSVAMDLYQGRKYQEAKAAFAAVKDRFKSISALENNHSTLSAFYEMECMRRLGDLDGLAAALQKFLKEPLTRETQLRQIEIYVLWDAVRTKSWDRVDILARERDKTKLPGDQRAQVAYCHGLALEGLERPAEALVAYSIAMTADAGASEEIARLAALRVLAIHKANPEVQTAIKVWGTADENKNSKGYSDLLEAASVAELFELSLGAGTPLPSDLKVFLKYKVKEGA
jgi:tetratricopeptide (TPR) repeat protein